jgi:ferrochelatase
MKKVAVVLFNLGGPDSLQSVQPFLKNLFSDPDIFKIPVGQKLFAKLISSLRSKKVANQYRQIGGKSPINELTENQKIALESVLQKENTHFEVFVAMRYWHPLTEEIVKTVEQGNFSKIILLSLYPHKSIVTTGSSINEWFRFYKGNREKIAIIEEYHNNSEYHKTINQRIDQTLVEFSENEKVEFLFSAHSVPQSLIASGDPYQSQILASIDGIMQQRTDNRQFHVSYQSKVGPVKWLEPSTEKFVEELGKNGVNNLLVIPISFVTDHIETLFELGIEYREVAERSGIKNFQVMKAINSSKIFINMLKNLVLEKL